MELKHVINERLKRLEPTDTRCYYCEMNESTSMNDNYFVPVFSENDRTNVVVYRSVKYQKIEIGIPRCKNCENIHRSAANKAKLYAGITAVAMVALGFAIWDIYGFFVIFPALFIGFGGAHYLEKKMVRKHDIFNKRDGAERNATVQDFIIRGWSFTQPSA